MLMKLFLTNLRRRSEVVRGRGHRVTLLGLAVGVLLSLTARDTRAAAVINDDARAFLATPQFGVPAPSFASLLKAKPVPEVGWKIMKDQTHFQSDVQYGYTTNASRQDATSEADGFFAPKLDGALMLESPSGKLMVLLESILQFEDYRRYDDNDTTVLVNVLGLMEPVHEVSSGQWYLTQSYVPMLLFGDYFGPRRLTLHNLQVGALGVFKPMGPESTFTLLISPRVWRVYSDPDEFKQTRVELSLKGTRLQLGERLSLDGDISFFGNFYDDFFESTFRRSREDFEYSMGLALRWMLLSAGNDEVSLSANLRFSGKDTPLGPALDFQRFDGIPSLTLDIKY